MSQDNLSVLDGAMVFMTALKNSGNGCFVPEFLKFVDSTLGEDAFEQLLDVMLSPANVEKTPEPLFILHLRVHGTANKIEAIKAIRNFSILMANQGYYHDSLGLKESKDFFEALEVSSQPLRRYAAPYDVILRTARDSNLSLYFDYQIEPA